MKYLNKIRFKIFLFLSNLLPRGNFIKVRTYMIKLSGINMGKNVRIAGKFYASNNNIHIGNNVWIGYDFNAYFNPTNKITIGNNVDIAPQVTFCCGSHEIGDEYHRAGKGYSRDIYVGDGCWICIKSIIMGGSNLESGCIVAGNSFVKGNFKKNILLGGNPASLIKVI